jgi:integrase
MVYVAAGCGLRIGEALGLEVGDIDFGSRELRVRRQLKVVTGRKPFLGPLKTKTSWRTVELPDVVADALQRHLVDGVKPVEVDDETDPRKPIHRLAALVFTSYANEPVNKPTWYRYWRPLRPSSGFRPAGVTTACGTTSRHF